MRLLVFCGTRAAIEKFDMLPDWEILHPSYGHEQNGKTMEAFKANPDGKLAALGKAFIHGWRAPLDTIVLFDASWPYGPGSAEWTQATARRNFR